MTGDGRGVACGNGVAGPASSDRPTVAGVSSGACPCWPGPLSQTRRPQRSRVLTPPMRLGVGPRFDPPDGVTHRGSGVTRCRPICPTLELNATQPVAPAFAVASEITRARGPHPRRVVIVFPGRVFARPWSALTRTTRCIGLVHARLAAAPAFAGARWAGPVSFAPACAPDHVAGFLRPLVSQEPGSSAGNTEAACDRCRAGSAGSPRRCKVHRLIVVVLRPRGCAASNTATRPSTPTRAC